MSLSRRGFIRTVGTGGRPAAAALVAARGREALYAETWPHFREEALQPPGGREIRISSNENPLGPGKTAIDALVGKFPQFGRYPFNSTPTDVGLTQELAKKYAVKPENIVLGAGSGEVLRNAVRAFTSPAKPLVTANCTFESPTRMAQQIGTPVKEVPLTAQLTLDVEAMAAAAKGAGLVFFCNPNNPTATIHSLATVTDFVKKVRQASPDTAILVDEAYFDYVTDPSYGTALPLAMEHPNVFITRTFSKAYGMAGLRCGYAIGQAATIAKLARFRMPYNVSVPTIGATIAALNDPAHIEAERKRNTEVRAYTVRALEEMGFHSTPSQGNFIFVNLKRPAADFRKACAAHGVMVGRDFPPYEKTHARISIGTMDEMKQAVDVFRKVLGATTTASIRG